MTTDTKRSNPQLSPVFGWDHHTMTGILRVPNENEKKIKNENMITSLSTK